jgi:hypothetical protein
MIERATAIPHEWFAALARHHLKPAQRPDACDCLACLRARPSKTFRLSLHDRFGPGDPMAGTLSLRIRSKAMVRAGEQI